MEKAEFIEQFKSRTKALAVAIVVFYAKMSIVVEEADETVFWLEMLRDTKMASNEELKDFISEAVENFKSDVYCKKKCKTVVSLNH